MPDYTTYTLQHYFLALQFHKSKKHQAPIEPIYLLAVRLYDTTWPLRHHPASLLGLFHTSSQGLLVHLYIQLLLSFQLRNRLGVCDAGRRIGLLSSSHAQRQKQKQQHQLNRFHVGRLISFGSLASFVFTRLSAYLLACLSAHTKNACFRLQSAFLRLFLLL